MSIWRKEYWIIGALVAAMGLVVRFLAIQLQPLWLDEQYSIYFAHRLKLSQFFFATPDSHPGLYYFILKLASQISENLFFLRASTALIPAIASVAIMLWCAWKYYNLKSTAILIIFIFLWLNPFVINFSWQLRMYGFLMLGISLNFLISTLNERHHQKKYYLAFLGSLIFSHAITYVAYFWTIGWLCKKLPEVFKKPWSRTHALWLSVLTIATTQFLIQSAGQVKDTFFWAVSWVQTPNLLRVISLFETVAGYRFDTMLHVRSLVYADIVFLLVVGVVIYLLTQKFTMKGKDFFTPIGSLVLFPSALIIFLSVFLPLLADRFFFYQFIPKISIFLPRVFLPMYYMAAFFIPTHISRTNSKILYITVIFLCFVWFQQWSQFLKPIYAQDERTSFLQNTTRGESLESEYIWFPSWLIITSISSSQDVTDSFQEQFVMSTGIEDALAQSGAENDLVNACNYLKNKRVASLDPDQNTASKTDFFIQDVLKSCCVQTQTHEPVTLWLCTQ